MTTRAPLDTTTQVETPEHVRFQYRVAGPARRALAYLVDALIRGIVLLVVALAALAAGISAGDGISRASTGVILLVMFVLEWGYYVFFETLWSGRTLGKRVLSLRVVTEGGHPLRFGDSLLRNLLRAADFLPGGYAIGLLVMGRDARFRRLGDLVAGTIVVVEDRQEVGEPLRLTPPPAPEELRILPQKPPVSGEELDAIELFLRRRGKLYPAREQELAQIIAPVLAKRMGVRYHDPARFLGLVYFRAREHGPSAPAPASRRR